jgi:ATP-dependent RNA helicase HelY
VFATETLALGINMPARSVVIERLEKYDGEGHVLLTPGQYTQLTGRAGRRGIDSIGHAVVLHQRSVDFRQVASLVGTRTYPLHSSFRPSYNMVVNLLRGGDVDRAERVLRASFAQFETDADVARDARRLAVLEEQAGSAPRPDAPHCDAGSWTTYWEIRRALTEHERATGRGRRRKGREDVTDRARIAGLRREQAEHPCHHCPERHQHEEQQRLVDRSTEELDRLRRSVQERTGSLVRRFHQLADVLRRRGYLASDDTVTTRGRSLSGIYADVDLLVAELLVGGHLDGSPRRSSPVSPGCSSTRRGGTTPWCPDRLPTPRSTTLRRLIEDVAAAHPGRRAGGRCPAAAGARCALRRPVGPLGRGRDARGGRRDREISGGDFVRNVKQALDLLGQLRDASDGERRAGFEAAQRCLRRGIVDA